MNLAALLLGAAWAHTGLSALILYDSNTSSDSTQTLKAALEADYIYVELSATDESAWDGSNPAPDNFWVVIHLNGHTATTDMPAAGQAALLSFVQNGGGYIHSGMVAWEHAQGRLSSLSDLILFDSAGIAEGSFTLSEDSAWSSHPLLDGVSSSFTFTGANNRGKLRSFSTDPAIVLMTDSSGYDAVAMRVWGDGHIVGFNHGDNYGGYATLADSELLALYVAAVFWAGPCDGDEDGYLHPDCHGLDCDDTEPLAALPMAEVCDGVDNNCDGNTDGAYATDATLWYSDQDGDGYGDASSATRDCSAPSGAVANSLDCDDSDSSTNPGGLEVCGGGDEDCDSQIDETDASDAPTWYADADGDGHGDPSWSRVSCTAPLGYVALGDDCDDGESSVAPSADELCDGVDNNCDSLTDDNAIDAPTWTADDDGDGYGSPTGAQVQACSVPAGYGQGIEDCDDSDASISPDADEICDGQDNNCDSFTDEDSALDALTWTADLDGDGHGAPDSGQRLACEAPSGFVASTDDCDDNDADTYPKAPESPYDGIDQDCDGLDLCDEDGDGQDSPSCGGLDCDDGNSQVLSGAEEIWYDGLDSDCDGLSDYDQDQDGQDALAHGGQDCDDLDPEVYWGAPDGPYDGEDRSCGYWGEEGDVDGDGHLALDQGGDDCDDQQPEVHPGAEERWYDGIDQDCDGRDDDQDGDGYALLQDCDDEDPLSFPGAEGLDEDCRAPTKTEEPETCSSASGAWSRWALALLLARRRDMGRSCTSGP